MKLEVTKEWCMQMAAIENGCEVGAGQGSKDWKEDCIKWHGRVLDGIFPHWCPEWDDLPIDSECMEIIACSCYKGVIFDAVRKEHQKELDEINDQI